MSPAPLKLVPFRPRAIKIGNHLLFACDVALAEWLVLAQGADCASGTRLIYINGSAADLDL